MFITLVSLTSPPPGPFIILIKLIIFASEIENGMDKATICARPDMDIHISYFVAYTRQMDGSNHGSTARLPATRHPTTIPTLIMHPNGTYDWSYGLHPLIWATCCPLFTPSHAFFYPVCHDIRPPFVPLGASPTFTPAVPVHSSAIHLPTHRASKCTCSVHLSRHMHGMVEDIGFC